jgi:lipopolysaccharide export system permease protein
MAVFEDRYSELEYEYINRVDKFASITKNGIWLKQFNTNNNLSSVLYAKDIKNEGETLSDFMILEYDKNGSFQARLDGDIAKLNPGYWEMSDVLISPKFNNSYFEKNFKYQTNIKIEDISDSLSAPLSISFWRLGKFIQFLENLGYSAVDFKIHYYNLIFLPFLMASLLILSASISNHLKQNDKFFTTFITSFILIFFIYFVSNLFDALGSSSQINPLVAKGVMPIIVILLSTLFFRYPRLIGR